MKKQLLGLLFLSLNGYYLYSRFGGSIETSGGGSGLSPSYTPAQYQKAAEKNEAAMAAENAASSGPSFNWQLVAPGSNTPLSTPGNYGGNWQVVPQTPLASSNNPANAIVPGVPAVAGQVSTTTLVTKVPAQMGSAPIISTPSAVPISVPGVAAVPATKVVKPSIIKMTAGVAPVPTNGSSSSQVTPPKPTTSTPDLSPNTQEPTTQEQSTSTEQTGTESQTKPKKSGTKVNKKRKPLTTNEAVNKILQFEGKPAMKDPLER